MSADLAVYLDSSALVKLIVEEAESKALARHLRARPVRVSCALARVEVVLAVRPHGDAATRRARQLLDRVSLLRLDDVLLDAAADEAALAQRAQGERDRGPARADEATELLLRDRQAQDDPVGADVAAAVGQVPQQAVQAILDAWQVAEGEGDGRAPRPLVDAIDEGRGKLRVARDALGEGSVEDE